MNLFDKFKARIVYKSGYTHDFWVWKLEIEKGKYTWSACNKNNKPVLIGVDEIAAVYIVDHKKVFRFTDPVKG